MNAEDPVVAADLIRLDRDRFLTTSFAPRNLRTSLCALLAFNMELARVRESVTQPVLGQIRLQWWRDTLDAMYSTNTIRRHPVAEALAVAIERHDLALEPLQAMIEAREQDLIEAAPQDMASLKSYARDTGGNLNKARLAVLGIRDEAAVRAAELIGTAWALSGIARAVPFHARHRRVLIPADLAEMHGIDLTQLLDGGRPTRVSLGVAAIAGAAADCLSAAAELRPYIGRAALPALLEGRLAGLYLQRLRLAGFDPFVPSIAEPLRNPAWHLLLGYAARRYY